MDSKQIAVVGAGTMGAGIAQIAVEAGHRVTLIDTTQEFVDRGLATIAGFLDRKVSKQTLTEDARNEIHSRLQSSTDMEAGVAGAAMVVEAVFENLELKQEIFERLDACTPREVILASNTSTLPISKIALAAKHPERVIGTHYFSPVPLMRLVEVVRGEQTIDLVAEQTVALCESFGKTPILIQDVPGFIVNRFLCLLYNEAANLIHSGVAGAEEIDAALKLGCNWPMGVAEIMDLAGVDITLQALTAMHEMTDEERYRPSPLLQEMVADNRLGRKTGQGFYEHP
ncbi:MAG: 3-hydroxyacyl-CoA dehydrogenase family protein [Acidimicrobiales bacterium]